MAKKVIIIGGGVAGLAAAASLVTKGAEVILLESRPFLGGRIYSFIDPVTKDAVDNGQHLFAGFYSETFRFLSLIGSGGHIARQKYLSVDFIDKACRWSHFRSHCLPSPINLLVGLAGYSKFPKRDLWRLLIGSRKLRGDIGSISAAGLLSQMGLSEKSQSAFFRPLVLATLNADLHEISGRLFQTMLKTIFSLRASEGGLAYSTVGFSELFAEPANSFITGAGGRIHLSTPVKKIVINHGRVDGVQDGLDREWKADAYIVAVPPDVLLRLLPEGSIRHLGKWSFSPIVSVNIWFDRRITDKIMVGFLDGKFHWYFDKSTIISGPERHRYVSLLASSAYDKIALPKEKVASDAVLEIKKYFPAASLANIYHIRVIQERRATVLITPDMYAKRPATETGWDNLFLAGDWIDTGLPATVESAVKSGFLAADFVGHL